MLIIRPHHINYLFFFKGLGYNYDFTSNMNNIKNTLIKDSNIKIKLVSHCDMICNHCPSKSSDICLFHDKVTLLDYNTLNEYHLNINTEYDFSYIIENIYKKYDYKKFFNICNTCEWFKKGVCSINIIPEQKDYWLKFMKK
ncbi:DUF1284 domain-containing protein [Clostridium butyricum]